MKIIPTGIYDHPVESVFAVLLLLALLFAADSGAPAQPVQKDTVHMAGKS